jgi:hypothetical protein
MEKQSKLVGSWSDAKVIETLMLKNAHSAMRGKPCPVAAKVVQALLNKSEGK